MKRIIIANNNNRIGVMQLNEKNLRYFIYRNVKLTSRKKHYDYRGYSAKSYNDNEKFLTKSLKRSKIY